MGVALNRSEREIIRAEKMGGENPKEIFSRSHLMFDLSVVSLNSSFPYKTGPWGVADQRRSSLVPRLEGESFGSGVF